MRWAWVLAILMLTAGCVGIPDENNTTDKDHGIDRGPPEEADTEVVTRELVFEADVEGPSLANGRLDGIEWPAPLGPGLVGLNVHLDWEEATNRFGLDIERPSGDVEHMEASRAQGESELDGRVPNAEPGPYTFYPTGQGPIVSDHLVLTATATFELPKGENATAGLCTDIQVDQTQDGYRASFTCQASGPAPDRQQVSADTVNGAIILDGAASEPLVTVTAWGRGDTEEEARSNAEAIEVTVSLTSSEIVANAEAPDWQDRGADVEVQVLDGTTLTGTADTTNGAVRFSSLAVDGFSADTTNGAIEGDLRAQGELGFDTTNGQIEVDIHPVANAEILADTTNGQIDLGLLETSEIAYTIDAEVSNGELSEDMQEARLEGGERDATLRTQDGDGRPIQVTGTTDTVNGDIHFAGLSSSASSSTGYPLPGLS